MKTALRKFAWLTLLTLTAGLHHVRAQTIIFSEGFERGFPGAWSVGDDHTTGSPAYWLDVDADFGGEGTHAGSRKGDRAGIGHAGDSANPTYQNDMSAYLSWTIDLSSHSSATLTFWHKIPSIESGYDQARVLLSGIDPIELWSASTPTAAWTLVTLDLTPYVGNSRTLTFRFDSDSSATAEGYG